MTIPYQLLLMGALAIFAIILIKSMRPLRPSEVVQGFAKDAVERAKAEHNLTLDYSPASIENLEKIIAAKFEEIQDAPILPIQIEALAKVWGSYLGEVIRRQRGGIWSIPKDGPFAGLCTLQTGEEQICPLSKVYGRLSNGEEDNLFVYSQLILDRAGLKKLSLDRINPGSAASPPA